MSGVSPLQFVQPDTLIVVATCSAIWLYIYLKNVDGYTVLGINYDCIVRDRQRWRVITAQFSHVSLIHLVFNMSSTYSMSFLEIYLEWIGYWKLIFLLTVLDGLIVIGLYHVLIFRFHREQHRVEHAIGFSAILFGMMTYQAMLNPGGWIKLLWVVPVPSFATPFMSLILTQMIVPRASFIGHLSGILAGFLLSFGLYDWIDDYFFVCALTWVIIDFIRTLKSSFPDSRYLKWIVVNEEELGNDRSVIVNGTIVPRSRQANANNSEEPVV